MTRVIVNPEASSRQVATLYAHVAEAALSLRAAIDAAEGLLPVASVVVLERLRQRASAVAHELEGPFLGRESSAPFADRLDPRAWLRWLDKHGSTDGLSVTSANPARTVDSAASRCASIANSPADQASAGMSP